MIGALVLGFTYVGLGFGFGRGLTVAGLYEGITGSGGLEIRGVVLAIAGMGSAGTGFRAASSEDTKKRLGGLSAHSSL